jgi:hypothetical protein
MQKIKSENESFIIIYEFSVSVSRIEAFGQSAANRFFGFFVFSVVGVGLSIKSPPPQDIPSPPNFYYSVLIYRRIGYLSQNLLTVERI